MNTVRLSAIILGAAFCFSSCATVQTASIPSKQSFKPRIRDNFPAFGAAVGPQTTTIYPALNTHLLRCNKPHLLHFRVVQRVPVSPYERALYLFVRPLKQTKVPDDSVSPDFVLGAAHRSVDQVYYSPAVAPSRAYFFNGRWNADLDHHESIRIVKQAHANGLYERIGFSAYSSKLDWDEFEIEVFVEYRRPGPSSGSACGRPDHKPQPPQGWRQP